MKQITIDGKIFQYKVEYWGDEGPHVITSFYYGTEERKVGIWPLMKLKIVPREVFSISADIEDPEHTKEGIRTMVMEEYERWSTRQTEIKKRKEELARGEII